MPSNNMFSENTYKVTYTYGVTSTTYIVDYNIEEATTVNSFWHYKSENSTYDWTALIEEWNTRVILKKKQKYIQEELEF